MIFTLRNSDELEKSFFGNGPRTPRRWDAFADGIIDLGGTRFCPAGLALAILGVANKTIKELYGPAAHLGMPEADSLVNEQIPLAIAALSLDGRAEKAVKESIGSVVAVLT